MELVFGKANAKLKALEKIYGKLSTFSVLSGHTCPYAKECHSQVDLQANGHRKIKDGPHTKFRCFSASQEVLFTNVYKRRKFNHDAIHSLETSYEMADALCAALPKDARIIRIHVSGDFFNEKYFKAWMLVACRRPDVLFYAYTKSLKYWIANRDNVPNNLVLTASRGGYTDELIEKHGLRSAKVVFSQQEADELGLEVDHDDVHAADPARANQDFALLIHGVQPKGSNAANALKILKQEAVA